MSDYSKSPLDVLVANQQKGYVGLHIEQGVPLLDRDLNLLHDLITATVRSVFTRYIGSGIPAGADGFAIQPLASPQDFTIMAGVPGGPGTCLVGGIEVTISAPTTYKAQAGVPALTTPSNAQPDPRIDVVYLDVSFAEVDGTVDSDLNNSMDVGMETSVRLKPAWVVLVAEGIGVPVAPAGHAYYPLAQLQRRRGKDTIDATMITDLRQRRLTVSDLEPRLSLLEKLLLFPSFAASPNQFAPKTGPVGQPVNLSGRNFNLGTVSVSFGGVVAAIVGAPTVTSIVANVPAGATGNVKISVTTDGGKVVSDDSFNVLPPPPAPAFAPSPNQFSPKTGPVNQPVTLNGTNFDQPGLQVTIPLGIGAGPVVPCPLDGAVTATQIPIRMPSAPLGAKRFTVTTNSGNVTSTDTFTLI